MTDHIWLNDENLRSADSLGIQAAGIDTLDLRRVEQHIREAVRRERLEAGVPTDSMEYLLRRRCAIEVDGSVHPTLAGVLCFGHHPQDLLPHAVVDIGRYSGTQARSDQLVHLQKNVGGTIFDQLRTIETYVMDRVEKGMSLDEASFQRIERQEYPRAVIRELSVNAISHRDYLMSDSVTRAIWFRDHIQWESPGGLPRGVTVENLLSISRPRNRILVQVLYEAGYVEAFGQGLDTVVQVLHDEGMDPPVFEDPGSVFIVKVFRRAFESPSDPYAHLPESQQRIMHFLVSRSEAAPHELHSLFGNERTPRSVQRDLDKLAAAGLVSSSGDGRARRYAARRGRDSDGRS